MIRLLKPTMEIERAQMRLKLVLPAREARRVREKISSLITIEQEDWTSDLEIVSTTVVLFMKKPLFNSYSQSCMQTTQCLAHDIMCTQMRSVVLCVYSGVFDGSGMLLQSGRGGKGRDQRERDGGSVEFEGCGGGR